MGFTRRRPKGLVSLVVHKWDMIKIKIDPPCLSIIAIHFAKSLGYEYEASKFWGWPEFPEVYVYLPEQDKDTFLELIQQQYNK